MTQQDTQPPAETLAEIAKIIRDYCHEGVKREPFDGPLDTADIAATAILAALTRRTGDDAIPAGMKPWHGGIFPPEDWDGGKVLLANGDYEGADTLYQDSHDTGSNQWHHRRPGGIGCDIIAYTPKPPAGGDAGARLREVARMVVDASDHAGFNGPIAEAACAALALPAPVVEGGVDKLREALRDLVSWFPEDGPTVYGPWIIKAGEYGADDAVAAARAALGDDA